MNKMSRIISTPNVESLGQLKTDLDEVTTTELVVFNFSKRDAGDVWLFNKGQKEMNRMDRLKSPASVKENNTGTDMIGQLPALWKL